MMGTYAWRCYGVLAATLVAVATPDANAAQLRALYAGPASYGPPVVLGGCFASRPWLRFSVVRSNTGGVVVFRARVDGRWVGVVPGQTLRGQSILLRAKSTGTGGYVKIAIRGSCIP